MKYGVVIKESQNLQTNLNLIIDFTGSLSRIYSIKCHTEDGSSSIKESVVVDDFLSSGTNRETLKETLSGEYYEHKHKQPF